MVRPLFVAGILVVTAAAVGAQDRRTEPVEVRCPAVLGVGVTTDLAFCAVLIQQDAESGIVVIVPPHRGEATLSFNLHNRHTYSAAEDRAGRAYAEYTAEIAVATLEGNVVGRRYILSEFRTADDLIDRVSGGAGPSGVKAVAPTGLERVFVAIPDGLEAVSIVGQSLDAVRLDGRESVRSVGRPVAVISDVTIEYRAR